MVQSLPMFVPDMLKTEMDILERQPTMSVWGSGLRGDDDHRRGAPFLRLKRAE
jgi:hypothetical protein